MIEAIILAGGLGTRLRELVSDVPKTMALVNKRPFLSYILDYLLSYGCQRVILSVGYKQEIIMNYFQNQYKTMQIVYSAEEHPLGTGGAIKQALAYCKCENVLVLNGDTFFQVDLNVFLQCVGETDLALCAKSMTNFDRFGSIVINNNTVVAFQEKKFTTTGYINGGIYMLNKNILDSKQENIFSFEDFLQQQTNIKAFISDAYFIDIGVPSDYIQAQKDFKELF